MKRIAFFGPLPPAHTGISDYDVELLPLLRKHYEIDVYVDQQTAEFPAYRHHEFYFRQRGQPYDLIVYQMGNSMFHEYMYSYLFEYPGAVVFHDYCLHQSRAMMLLRKGLIEEYRQEAEVAHPEHSHRLANVLITGAVSELLFSYYSFTRLILLSALSAGAHTDVVARKLNISGTPVVKIPMAVLAQNLDFERDPFPGKMVIASFGLATRGKRILQVLPAVANLRRTYPNIIYLIVGEVANHFGLSDEIAKWELQNNVVATGHVEKRDFLKYIRRADIVVNLRYPSAGEMSASLLRAMQAGKPVLISRLHYNNEIPEGSVVRIPTDREEEAIYTELEKLIRRPDLRTQLGIAAKQYVDTHHTPEQMVDAYRELIENGLARKPGFVKPDLPSHLRSGHDIVRNYIGDLSTLLEQFLP